MKPTIGRIVLFKARNQGLMGNNATEIPAIITHVWSDTCVNLTVFRNEDVPVPINGVEMADDLDMANLPSAWRWPPREA